MSPETKAIRRPEKIAIVDEIRGQVAGATFVILTDYRGMKVAQCHELRKRLAKHRAQFHVVRNSYFMQVARERRWEALVPALAGSTAMVVGSGDAVETAKAVKAFGQETKLLAIKMGVYEGQVLDAAAMGMLVTLPPRGVLYAMMVGALAAPMAQLVGVMRQKLSSLLYVLTAVREKKTKEQSNPQ